MWAELRAFYNKHRKTIWTATISGTGGILVGIGSSVGSAIILPWLGFVEPVPEKVEDINQYFSASNQLSEDILHVEELTYIDLREIMVRNPVEYLCSFENKNLIIGEINQKENCVYEFSAMIRGEVSADAVEDSLYFNISHKGSGLEKRVYVPVTVFNYRNTGSFSLVMDPKRIENGEIGIVRLFYNEKPLPEDISCEYHQLMNVSASLIAKTGPCEFRIVRTTEGGVIFFFVEDKYRKELMSFYLD